MQTFHVFFRISRFPIGGDLDRPVFLALASHIMRLCIHRLLSLFSCLRQKTQTSPAYSLEYINISLVFLLLNSIVGHVNYEQLITGQQFQSSFTQYLAHSGRSQEQDPSEASEALSVPSMLGVTRRVVYCRVDTRQGGGLSLVPGPGGYVGIFFKNWLQTAFFKEV